MVLKFIHNYPPNTSSQTKYIFIRTAIFCILMSSTYCGPVLSNNQIIFQMSGTTTYIPDNGGLSRTGYKLTVGYSGKQWLGVEIVTQTSKNDVLIMQINEFYTEGDTPLRTGHEVSVTDYYRTGDNLNYDQNIQYDISAFSYSHRKQFSIDMVRYLGSNSGQDWNAAANAYGLIKVCFYSSDTLFDITTWLGGVSQCYFFEIDNYYSEFKGVKLKNFYVNGYSTGIYGWIDGPYVNDNVYIYHKVPLFTYTKQPAVVMEIGTTTAQVGQDFNVYSPVQSECGDYYGVSVTSMVKDTNRRSGFNNNGLTVKHWNAVPANQIAGLSFTALRISYSRNISTFDAYDRQLLSTFIFCMYIYGVGNINSDLTDKSCEMVELSYHYVRTTMPDKVWEFFTQFSLFLMIVFLINL